MAERESIEVSYNRKVQLEQFEPVQFGAVSTVALEDGDDPKEVFTEEAAFLEDAVERELARRIARKKNDSGDD